jgi:16S rRNA (guanine966-N2)-methyltransferase
MKHKTRKNCNQVRIIGGQFRGRKINFADLPGLRPTPDRVRETLFNWLAPVITSAYCLDLFCGSGALGFEALSRGARHVTFVDREAEVVSTIKKQLALFAITHASVYQAQVPQLLSSPTEPYNVIFLDPPFGQNLIDTAGKWLEQQSWLAENALIYVEAEIDLSPLPVPQAWEVLRHKTAGKVAYYLLKRGTPTNMAIK